MYAIIPARGGSKGIPRKNLANIMGYPLIGWSIRTALAVPWMWPVVATEDAKIADVSNEYGASVVMVPAEMCQDDSPADPVVLEAVNRLGVPDEEPVVMIQCTSPLLEPDDLRAGLRTYSIPGLCDSLFSGYPLFPYLWTFELEPVEAGRRKIRQKKEPNWLENGAYYVFRAGGMREHGARLHGTVEVQGTDFMLEIDEPDDLELAEWMLRKRGRYAPEFSRTEGPSGLSETAARQQWPPTSPQRWSDRDSSAIHSAM